jgi:hypothetical protein
MSFRMERDGGVAVSCWWRSVLSFVRVGKLGVLARQAVGSLVSDLIGSRFCHPFVLILKLLCVFIFVGL